jgi:AcrR family transcriptional regulator
MTSSMSTNGTPPAMSSLRERQKAATREAIIKAALEALAENRFERATHDVLAERVGCARRTVYRYFPDRDALMNAMWSHIIRDPSAVAYSLPTDTVSLTETLGDFFEQMDANALAITVAMTTPRGRELRATVRDIRADAWRKAMAERVEKLPESDQELPMAVLQMLRSGFAWLEMRDQWKFKAAQTSRAVKWATEVLLADLEARKGAPLAEGPAATLRPNGAAKR